MLENQYKIVVPLFGAAFAAPNKGTTIFTDLGLHQQWEVLQKKNRIQGLFKAFDFPVLFKADLIFKDFSRKPSKFKYFSSLCEP